MCGLGYDGVVLYYSHRLCISVLPITTRPPLPLPSSMKLLRNMAYHKGKSCISKLIYPILNYTTLTVLYSNGLIY